MPVDFAGAAVGASFGELLSLVKDVAKAIAAFHPQLKKIESTLSEIDPIIKDIYVYYEQLDRLKEMDPIKELLDEGKGLVSKCLRIRPINLCKRYTHSKKLTEYNAAVKEKCQIYMQLILVKNDGKILSTMQENPSIISGQANGGALQSGLKALGNLAVPAAPAFMVGSQVETSTREIKLRLLEEGVSVIVVTAPGGCGKTTLLKKLCHDREIKGKFNNIMFVTVSKKPNLIDIVQKMYQHNGLEQPEIKTEDGAIICLEQLLNKIGQNPVLLVLDDVWAEWESILKKFVCNDIKDYKIVVTSRYEFPFFRPVHHLNPLPHDEAVNLFRQSVAVNDKSMDAPDDETLDKIVKRCKGLPLALTVVAKSLRGKDRPFWERKLLDWSKGHSLLGSESEILDCLRMSLDDLDGDKERFMDLGLFPEDCMIPATALIDLWVELYKLDFDGVRAIADLHELNYRNLADLVVTRRDLIDDDDKSYNNYYASLHDLLRELAIIECSLGEVEKRERLILDLTGNSFPDWWSAQKLRTLGARLVSISTDGTFSTPWPNLHLPEAEAIVLNFETNIQTKTYALPEFIEKAHKLKALIVTNSSFFSAKLGNFHVVGSNIRRIRLERVTVPFMSMGELRLHSLEKISFFMCDISQASTSNNAKISDAMPNLLELDIDYCNDFMTLPDGICEIKPLRKLNITNCHNFTQLPEQIGQLESLEVVRLNSCSILSQLPDSISTLKKLISLNVSDCLSLSTLPNQIGQLVNLKRMNMRGCQRLSVLPRSIIKLRSLRKVICDKEKEVMWQPFKSSLKALNIMASEEEANLDWLRN